MWQKEKPDFKDMISNELQQSIAAQQQRAEIAKVLVEEKAKKVRLEAQLTQISVENARMEQIKQLAANVEDAQQKNLPAAYIAHLQQKLDNAIQKSMQADSEPAAAADS